MSVFDPRPGEGSTILNWVGQPLDQLFLYAEAYQRAAQCLLVSQDLDCGGLSDFDACPVVFLYRHALELGLKSVLLAGASFLGGSPEDILSDGHDLRKLFARFEHLCRELGLECDTELGEAVEDIAAVDSQSMAFRYTITKKLDPSLHPHFEFSVRAFGRQLDPILDGLKGYLGYVMELAATPRD